MGELSERELHMLICEANEAKDRLYRISVKLDEAGKYQKAKSLMTLVSRIEEWQNAGWRRSKS